MYYFCLNFSYSPSISLSIVFSLSFYLCTLREIIYEQWVTTVIYSGINNVLLKDVGMGKTWSSHHFETLDILLIWSLQTT